MTTNPNQHRPPLQQVGLYDKYLVFKNLYCEIGGKPSFMQGDRVEGCFVLRPDRDPAAREALWAYATASNDEALKADLKAWLYRLNEGDRPCGCGSGKKTWQCHKEANSNG